MLKKKLSNIWTGKAIVVMAMAATLWVGGGISEAAFTAKDLAKAHGNVAAGRKIFEDESTPVGVRNAALEMALSFNPAVALEYLDTPFMEENPAFASAILKRLALIGSDKWKDDIHYPQLLKQLFESAQGYEIFWSQKMHVRTLLKAGKGTEALSEAKRLFAITPLRSELLSDAVQIVSTAVRGDALARGKSLKEALAAQNAYLDGIKKGDVSQTAFAAAPFPAAHAAATAQEKNALNGTWLDALLFNGKFDVAQKIIDGLVASAIAEDELRAAIQMAGRVANAKSGVPTAANELTQ